MSDLYSRAQLLMSQRRFDLARQDLGRILTEQPGDSTAHALLALCLINTNENAAAEQESRLAIASEPDDPLPHYVASMIAVKTKRYEQAIDFAGESLRLDPDQTGPHVSLGQAYFSLQQFDAMLQSVNAGLTVDPDDIDLGNLRTVALERLGRTDEAIATSKATLSRAPDDSYSHTAYGWTLVNSGEYVAAQNSFREAMRLDPDNEHARNGMITALNSRSWLFRRVHQFYVLMSRLNSRAAVGIIFGAWLLVQLIGRNANRIPGGEAVVLPIIALYFVFVVITWIATPLFNTFLRFHPLGQHLLNRDEFWASNLIATTLALAAFSLLGIGLAFGFFYGLITGFYWTTAAVLIAVVFRMTTRRQRMLFAAAAVVILLLPILGIYKFTQSADATDLVTGLRQYGFGVLGMQIISGFVAGRR